MILRILLRLLPLLLAARLAAAQDELTVKSYPLRGADPQAIGTLVNDLVQPDGRVIIDRAGGRLIVRAGPEQHKAVAAALVVADAPAPNIRVEVTIEDSASRRETQAGVTGAAGVTLSSGDAGYDLTVRPQLSHEAGRESSSVRQQLLLLSGSEAQLFVGEEVAFQNWIVRYGHTWGYLEANTTLERVGAALNVQARVLGDGTSVALRLVPELSGFAGGHRRRIALTKAAVEVTGRSGQPLEIGGFGEHADLYNRYLAGIARTRTARQMRMVVVPTILPASAP